MGILNSIKQSKEIARLRKQAEAAPSPAAFGSLAERCIALGRLEDADRSARQGLELFPDSERLTAVLSFTKRYRQKARIGDLRRQISDKPNPKALAELARIYLDVGDQDQALHICEEHLARFPLNEQPYLIVGEVRLRRFFRERIAHDGVAAEQQLKQAVKLEPKCVSGRVHLGHLYFAVGAIDAMQEQLETVLEIAPRRSAVREFLDLLSEHPAACGPEDDEEEEGLPPAELIRGCETASSFRNSPADFGPSLLEDLVAGGDASLPPDEVALQEALAVVTEIPGVHETAFLNTAGEPLLQARAEEEAGDLQLTGLATAILKTAEEATKRMDLGTFQWCTVEGDFGGVTISRLRDVHLAARYGPPLRPGRAPRALEESAARIYLTPSEVGHA